MARTGQDDTGSGWLNSIRVRVISPEHDCVLADNPMWIMLLSLLSGALNSVLASCGQFAPAAAARLNAVCTAAIAVLTSTRCLVSTRLMSRPRG